MLTSRLCSVLWSLPSVLGALSGRGEDPAQISTGVHRTFADFMKTHWHKRQAQLLFFMAGGLDIVPELMASPSFWEAGG